MKKKDVSDVGALAGGEAIADGEEITTLLPEELSQIGGGDEGAGILKPPK